MPTRFAVLALLLAPLAAGAEEVSASANPPSRLGALRASWLTGLPSPGELDLAVDVDESIYLDLGLQRLDGWGGSVQAGWRTNLVDRRDARSRGETVDARLGAGAIFVPQHVASWQRDAAVSDSYGFFDRPGRGPLELSLAQSGTGRAALGARAVASVESIFWLEPHLGAGLLAEGGFTLFPGRHVVYGGSEGELPSFAGALAPEFRLAAEVAF